MRLRLSATLWPSAVCVYVWYTPHHMSTRVCVFVCVCFHERALVCEARELHLKKRVLFMCQGSWSVYNTEKPLLWLLFAKPILMLVVKWLAISKAAWWVYSIPRAIQPMESFVPPNSNSDSFFSVKWSCKWKGGTLQKKTLPLFSLQPFSHPPARQHWSMSCLTTLVFWAQPLILQTKKRKNSPNHVSAQMEAFRLLSQYDEVSIGGR